MLKRFKTWWRSNPNVRAWTRTIVTAGITYVSPIILGQASWVGWSDFLRILLGAGLSAVIGAATPVEPFFGKKAKGKVEVPEPPAVPDK